MNHDQEIAVDLAGDGHNVFVTGAIGTGKTAAIQHTVSRLLQKNKSVSVTASTGLASQQMKGCQGTTLHHWAGLRDGRYSNERLLGLLSGDPSFHGAAERIRATDTLIIDEISMISAKIFDQLEFVCRNLRCTEKVFGGIQVIVCGDFKQLKPVADYMYNDPGDYCFLSNAWQQAKFHPVLLNEVMRQADHQLVQSINDLAVGDISDESLTYLSSLSRPLVAGTEPIYLFARNFDVMMVNYDRLFELPGDAQIYPAVDSGETRHLKKVQAPKHLVLKIDCKVMLLTNLSNDLVNGLQGRVLQLSKEKCKVQFENGRTYDVTPYLFTVYSQEQDTNIATRYQFPLKLSYAITIHKAQGMNLSHVVVDAKHTFRPGQLATAVGRATTPDGLQLINFNWLNVPHQPVEITQFLADCDAADIPILPDLKCCRQREYVPEAIEYPLGPNPNLFNISDENDESVQNIETVNIDFSDVHDEMDAIMAQLDDFQSSGTIEQITVSESGESLPQTIPNDFEMQQFREKVQADFSGAETPSKKELKERDEKLDMNQLCTFIGELWSVFDKEFVDLERKGHGNLENRDFSHFLKNLEKYQHSPQYQEVVDNLYDHIPDIMDRRLAYKYTLKLVSMYLVYKEKTIRPQNVSNPEHSSNSENQGASPESLASIRYIGGMCFAKAHYKLVQIALNNVHKISERSKVCNARLRLDLLDKHIIPQSEIERSSKYLETLSKIQRQQNMRLSLTHITDAAFDFFVLFDMELSKLINRESLKSYRGDIVLAAESSIFGNDVVRDAWTDLFASDCNDGPFLIELMRDTVIPYVHVKFNEFRKDFISQFREDKTLEIRKHVWNKRSSKKNPSSSSSNESVPSEKRAKQVHGFTFDDIIGDSSPGFRDSHSMLHAICLSDDGPAKFVQLQKESLKILCRAYSIKFSAKTTKDSLVKSLVRKIPTCMKVLCPGVLAMQMHDQEQAISHPDNLCPICHQDYPDYSNWIGCDNEECGTYICRKCAKLEDEEAYKNAISSQWHCPVCT